MQKIFEGGWICVNTRFKIRRKCCNNSYKFILYMVLKYGQNGEAEIGRKHACACIINLCLCIITELKISQRAANGKYLPKRCCFKVSKNRNSSLTWQKEHFCLTFKVGLSKWQQSGIYQFLCFVLKCWVILKETNPSITRTHVISAYIHKQQISKWLVYSKICM